MRVERGPRYTKAFVGQAVFLANEQRFDTDTVWSLWYTNGEGSGWHLLGKHEGWDTIGYYPDRLSAEEAMLRNIYGDVAVLLGFCEDGGG